MLDALKRHWPAYLLEAAGLAVFMIGAGLFTAAFMHPASPLYDFAGSNPARRLGIGSGMAAVTIGLVYAAARSGAHLNPVVTLAFFSRGKIGGADAAWYVVAQFLGAVAAPHVILLMIGDAFRHDEVKMATTAPGPLGAGPAFAAELLITFGLVLAVLLMVDNRRLRPALPAVVGLLIGAYIAFESPLSGMSMNPARTFGSALAAGRWDGWWLYFVAPALGTAAALAAYAGVRRLGPMPAYEEGPVYPLAKKG